MKLFESFIIQLMEFKKKIKKIIYNRVFDSTNYESCFPMIFLDDFPPGDLLSAWSFSSQTILKLEWLFQRQLSLVIAMLSMFLFSITKLKDKSILHEKHPLNASQNIVSQTFCQACGPCFTCWECGCSNMQKHRRS